MTKKELIMNKALELFAKQGFAKTTIQQITDECGISKGAFYLVFKSKDELIIALIDHFMMQITEKIDRLVKTAKKSELIYLYFHTVFEFYWQHSNFAKIFVKEWAQTVNKEILDKLYYYDHHQNKSILQMVEKVYGDQIAETKYDLVFCIKSFIKVYIEMSLFNHLNINFDIVAWSLAEKTDILANHMTLPFITEENLQNPENQHSIEPSQQQILQILEQKISETEEPIIKESLLLLKEQVLSPSFSIVIVKGLLKNIQEDPECTWIAYLLRNYFRL